MTTTWAHLPNAAHIDRVIASVKANPEQWLWRHGVQLDRLAAWNAARQVVRVQSRNTEWDAAQQAAREAGWSAQIAAREAARHTSWLAARSVLLAQGREAAWAVARDAAWNAVRDAILALIAYDDCAYMLDSEPGELAIVAEFGNRNAILLLPACKAFHSIKESA